MDRLRYLFNKLDEANKNFKKGKCSLAKLAKCFMIDIPKDLTDYEIHQLSIDRENGPYIMFIDKTTNTHYSGKFTSIGSEIYYSCGTPKFIRAKKQTPTYFLSKLFLFQDPLVEAVRFNNGDDYLIFEITHPMDRGIDVVYGRTLSIRYDSIVGEGKKRRLKCNFEKHYAKDVFDWGADGSIYRENIVHKPNYSAINTSHFRSYIKNNKLAFIVDSLEPNDDFNSIWGICLENKNFFGEPYYPFSVGSHLFFYNHDESIISSIELQGLPERQRSTISIYKRAKEIEILYTPNKNKRDTVRIPLKVLNDGMISSEEIKIIYEELQLKYPNEVFVSLVLRVLTEFANELDIKHGEIQREEDSLSPELLYDKTIEEITEMVSSDPDKYIEMIKNQYKDDLGEVESKKPLTKKDD